MKDFGLLCVPKQTIFSTFIAALERLIEFNYHKPTRPETGNLLSPPEGIIAYATVQRVSIYL